MIHSTRSILAPWLAGLVLTFAIAPAAAAPEPAPPPTATATPAPAPAPVAPPAAAAPVLPPPTARAPAPPPPAAPAPPPVPAAAAAPSTPGPDRSPFTIPLVPIQSRGFGTDLAETCAALAKLSFASVPATARAGMPRAEEIARGTASPDDRMVLAVRGLKDTCERIAKDQLDEQDLALLRSFRDSGSFAALNKIIAELDDANVKADPKAALKRAAGGLGSLAGLGPLSSEALSGIEAKFVQGLADYLVTRAKQEAILFVKQHITEELCTVPDIRTLLPVTCATLEALDPSLSVAAMGATLNGAAKRDLEALPDGVLWLASKHDRPHYYVYEPARLAYAVYRQAAQGRNVRELVSSLHAVSRRSCESTPDGSSDPASLRCRDAFALLRVTSAMIHATAQNGLDLPGALSGAAARPLVVGTLLEGEASYRSRDAFRELRAEEVKPAAAILAEVARALPAWKIALDEIAARRKDDQTTPAERRRKLAVITLDAVRNLSRFSRHWLDTLAVGGAAARAQLIQTLEVADSLSSLGQDLVTEQYGGVASDVVLLVSELRVRGLLPPAGDAKIPGIDAVRSVIPLIGEIAAAESSQDVAAAFEAAAAPAGSYRAKYQRKLLSLNAFVGGIGALEVLRAPRDPVTNERATDESFAVGGFAPVGVHGTLPVLKASDGLHHLHLGLLLSLLDLGALTTQRLDDEVSSTQSTDSTANFGVEQIFSPGAYLTIGLFRTPFVIGGGASLAPRLRSVESKDASGAVVSSKDVSVLRYGGFLAMDLTLLSL